MKDSVTWKIVAGALAVIVMGVFGYWATWITDVARENGDKKQWMIKLQAQANDNKERLIRIEEKIKHTHP